jgi:type VI secretion system protein ImpA
VNSEPTLDIDALIRPIPNAPAPGGVPLAASLRNELERLRKPSPASADGATPGQRPAPDFRAVREDAIAALTDTSKDLGLLVRLIEANTRVYGVPGLRDGLALAGRLVVECWDWLHPIPKDAEDAGRGNRIKWLNSADAGAEFPQTVQSLPLVACGGERFSYFDTLDPARQAELDAALGQCDDKHLLATRQELADADAALTALAKELKARLGSENAPDLTGNDAMNLGTAVRNCRNFVESVATRRGLTAAATAPKAEERPASTTTSTAARTPSDGDSRESLYGQLERIAGALKRIEPHSPVPFLLERCVKLGKLPFPELMQALIRDGGVLSELDRLIGRDPA